MKVLVTGGAGFIGSHLVDALVARGDTVRILDALDPDVHQAGPPPWLNPHAEFHRATVQHYDAVLRAVDGMDAVCHFAARLGVDRSLDHPFLYLADNVLGTEVVLRASARAGVRTLLLPSSMGVYGEGLYMCSTHGLVHPPARLAATMARGPWELSCRCGRTLAPVLTDEETAIAPASVYSLTKYDQEALALTLARTGRLGDMAVTVLRYFNVYGPRQSLTNPYSGVCSLFAAKVFAGTRPTVYEDGLQTRDFVHISDVVQVNLRALDARLDGAIVNVGTETPTPIATVAQLVAEACGRADLAPHITEAGRPGDVRHCVATTGRLRQLLGYTPSTPFAMGLPTLVDWQRSSTGGV